MSEFLTVERTICNLMFFANSKKEAGKNVRILLSAILLTAS